MWRKWTKADRTLLLIYACIIAGGAQLSNTYQGCISFGFFLFLAFAIFLLGSILVNNLGARKSVLAGIGVAFVLECAALYAVLPEETYAEGQRTMQEYWLSEYADVELMGETRNYVSYFTGGDTESIVERFVNKITGRSGAPVLLRRPYVYIFGADRDIAACIYDPFSGESRIAVLRDMRFGDWKQALVMGGYGWEEDDGQGGL